MLEKKRMQDTSKVLVWHVLQQRAYWNYETIQCRKILINESSSWIHGQWNDGKILVNGKLREL